jgi:hypothetical protein
MASILSKALSTLTGRPTPGVRKAARGTLGDFVLGVSPQWGQPLPQVAAADASGLITPARMREVVLKTNTVSASTNAILDYASGVRINMRNIDAAKAAPDQQVADVRKLMIHPNPTQSQRQFMLALMRDIVTLGYGAVEIVFDSAGMPGEMWVMDAARLRIDFDEHGTILGYDMLNSRGVPIIRGQNASSGSVSSEFPSGPGIGAGNLNVGTGPGARGMHGWEPEEVIFFSLNPMSESVYPYSRITQLFSAAIIEDLMMFFISQRFTDSNVPFGVMDLGDVTEQELKVAITNWNAQANESHRILLTGSKGGSKWVPFGYHLKELEAVGLLSEVRMKIMGILGVTMNELGESQDINKSNGYNLSFTFKKRAIEPLLNEIVDTFSRRLLWDAYDFDDLEFYYDEIDSRDELLQAQIDDMYMKMGVDTINDVRNRRGQISVEGGDVNYVFTGSAWIPVSMLTSMAQTMVQAEQQATSASLTGPEGADTIRTRVGGQSQPGQKKPEGGVHAMRSVTGSKR